MRLALRVEDISLEPPRRGPSAPARGLTSREYGTNTWLRWRRRWADFPSRGGQEGAFKSRKHNVVAREVAAIAFGCAPSPPGSVGLFSASLTAWPSTHVITLTTSWVRRASRISLSSGRRRRRRLLEGAAAQQHTRTPPRSPLLSPQSDEEEGSRV